MLLFVNLPIILLWVIYKTISNYTIYTPKDSDFCYLQVNF